MNDHTTPSAAIAAILQWLASPVIGDPSLQLVELSHHLAALGNIELKPEQHTEILELLHLRTFTAIAELQPRLIGTTLPIPEHIRKDARNAKNALQALATAHMGDSNGTLTTNQRLHAMQALSKHLFIEALVAAPPGVGIWRQLHQLHSPAGIETASDEAIDEVYYRAQMLACTQPAALSAQELALVDAAIASIATLPDRPNTASDDYSGLFWIDPTQDLAATAASRKPPPPNLQVRWFACDRPAIALTSILDAIESGKKPAIFKLPEFAATPTGIATLRRVARCWDKPAKRRFHRRRQNIRASLLAGMNEVRELLRSGQGTISEWMITNESPDGCAAMHVRGPTGRIDIGDVVALRFEGEQNWQICVARWAQSENPEHLELGLQRLAPEASAATLVAPNLRTAALVFTTPGTPPRPTLMVAAGALTRQPEKAILLTERHNLDVRETSPGDCLEQTARIEWHALLH
jgi:hypothetical protein